MMICNGRMSQHNEYATQCWDSGQWGQLFLLEFCDLEGRKKQFLNLTDG